MDATEGLVRGQEVTDSGSPITVPVGPEMLGRIINVIGEPIDERGPVNATRRASIHREAPAFAEQSTEAEMLVTGIKVVDLLEIGRAHVCTPVTNAPLVCRLLLEKKNKIHRSITSFILTTANT